jgi:hypothetical protein
MKIRDLLAILNDLSVGDLDKEVYIDLPNEDEYKEMEFCPVVDPADEDVVIGYVISEATPPVDYKQLRLPFDGVH